MALFKLNRGKRAFLDNQPIQDGHAWFCVDDGTLWIDYAYKAEDQSQVPSEPEYDECGNPIPVQVSVISSDVEYDECGNPIPGTGSGSGSTVTVVKKRVQITDSKAVHSIIAGVQDGTISVDGVDVKVTGLKSAAYKDASEFATAAQGSLASSAIQPEDLTNTLKDYALTSALPTTVAELSDASEYAKVSQLPDVPTKVSAFENDKNYATVSQLPTTVAELTDSSDYAKVANIPTKVSELSNDSNFATVSQIPTKVSELNNDSNFATVSQLPTTVAELTDASNYALVANVPTTVAQLSDASNYALVSNIPTKVSDLSNDKNFATTEEVVEILREATGGESAADVAADLKVHKDATNPHNITCELIGAATADALATEKARLDAFLKLEDGQTLDAALDSLKELQDFITGEAAEADQMVKDIAAAKTQADKGVADAKTAQDEVDALEIVVGNMYTNNQIDGFVDGINNKIGTVPANKTVVTMIEEAKAEATYDDSALSGKVSVIEGVIPTLATKGEVNTKADASNVYTKEEIEAKKYLVASDIAGKADASSVYTKVEADGKFLTSVTKEDLVLGNVENKSSETIRSEITSSNVTTALGYTPVNPANLGDLASKNESSLNLGQYAKSADLGDLAGKNEASLNLKELAHKDLADLGLDQFVKSAELAEVLVGLLGWGQFSELK